jgi:RNA polymerase sigma-70 factor (ECF subfamily)
MLDSSLHTSQLRRDLQYGVLRLLCALEQAEMTSVRDFFRLAAEQMRRELLDLARRYRSRRLQGPGRTGEPGTSGQEVASPERPDALEDPNDLEKWCAFHEAVERLPAEQREVVGLIYYHGWAQEVEVAEHLRISKSSVQRHWAAAMVTLQDRLKDM